MTVDVSAGGRLVSIVVVSTGADVCTVLVTMAVVVGTDADGLGVWLGVGDGDGAGVDEAGGGADEDEGGGAELDGGGALLLDGGGWDEAGGAALGVEEAAGGVVAWLLLFWALPGVLPGV